MTQHHGPSARAADVIALGEVMLRFDPGEGRIRTARSFQVWEGAPMSFVKLERVFRSRLGI